MELINNRYRVIKNLMQNQLISSYIVADLLKDNKRNQINIFNNDVLPEGLLDFYMSEFLGLAHLNSSKIVKAYSFGVADSYDGKNLQNKKFFYTRENVEDYTSLAEFTEEIEEDKINDVFIQVCQAINYLHMKGYVYGELNLSNIYIKRVNDNYDIKLKDIATIELEKHMYWIPKKNQLQFKAPEVLYGNKPALTSDIYSLGVLFVLLHQGSDLSDVNFRQVMNNVKHKNQTEAVKGSECCTEDMYPLVAKMTNHYADKRYGSIKDIVEDINITLNTSYSTYIKEEIDDIVLRTRIVGRDRELKKILEVYDLVEQGKAHSNVFLVHGEHGIGKTRFLQELYHVFAIKKIDVYSLVDGEQSLSDIGNPVFELVKQLLPGCDQETQEHYSKDLGKIIPELADDFNPEAYNPLSADKEKLYLYNRMLNFIQDCIKSNPSVFMLDNLHLVSEDVLEIIEYMISNMQNKRVIIVLSYCDKDYRAGEKFKEFINKINNTDKRIHDITLGSLNIEETAAMIKNILSLPNLPMRLSTRIYTETYGNPLFIEEVIKNLYAEKFLYLNETDGSWDIEIRDYDKLPIPTSIYQAVLNQLRNLDSECQEILEIISIFNSSVSINAISEMLQMGLDRVEEKLEFLVRKGILDKKVEDWGYAYDLHNRGVKSFIYDGLDKNERKEKHKLAAEFLEKQYAEEKRENKEELIFHLEKAEEKEKVIDYCYQTAINMVNLQFRGEAIRKLEKALMMFSPDSTDKKKIEIMLKIGDIHNGDGNNARALECYEEVFYAADAAKDYYYCIDALNNIAEIYEFRNDIDKGTKYVELAEQYSSRVQYEGGYLKTQLILARLYYTKQQYDKVIDICERNIERCHGKYIELEARFYNTMGITYLDESLADKALPIFHKCIKLYEELNNTKGIAQTLNNIGVIYGDYYQDVNESINIYQRMKETCEKHNIVDLQILAESNLGECYYDEEDYGTSLECFKNSLELSKRIGFEGHVFYSYVSLCKASLKLYDYRNAFEYFNEAAKELDKYPVQRKSSMGEYYRIGGELYYAFGVLDKAEEYALKAYEIYKNDDFLSKWHTEALIEFVKLLKANDEQGVGECIDNIRRINENYASNIEKANNLYIIGMIAYGNRQFELADEIFKEADKLCKNINSDKVEARNLYVKAIFKKGSSKIKMLEKVLELSKKEGLKKHEIYAYKALGNYYFEHKEYYDAIKYYFEACEIIKKLALQIPEEYRANFMMTSNNIQPFRQLMEISKVYNSRSHRLAADEVAVAGINMERLSDLFEYKDLQNILTNKNFLKAAEKDYDLNLPKGLKNINDLTKNLSGDSIKDLELIVKYSAKSTLASRAAILLTDENHEINTAAASGGIIEISTIRFILEKVNATKEPLFIAEKINGEGSEDIDMLPKGIKAVICIPIARTIDVEKNGSGEERRKSLVKREQVMGYLYLDSDRIINNFNDHNFDECCQFSSLIQIIAENYRLKIIASIDKLTGVFTRKYLEDSLKEELERSGAVGSNFSLIMFDIDKFKNINDRFGHQKGDLVLREICSIVKRSIRREDICGRYGGEEFVIILPDTVSKDASIVAEKLRKRVEEAKILGDKHPVTMSLGVVSYPEHGEIEQELIEKVDQALYVAKESGRNRSQEWNSQISNKAKRKDRLAGIVSGNMVQDHRNVLAMIELIELIKEGMDREDKIYKLLGRIIEITEAQNGMLFIVEDGQLTERYGRRKFEEGWIEVKRYNRNMLENVIRDGQGVYRVDWDDIIEYDSITGAPDWQSVIVTPLIKSQEVKGVLYLTVSTKVKEFDFNHFNFVNALGDITAAIL